MEIVEKQVEKIKEVPYGYWDSCPHYGCNNRGWNVPSQMPATRGVAGAGLGLTY